MTMDPHSSPTTPSNTASDGRGRVRRCLAGTVVVRFGNELHQLPARDTDIVPSLITQSVRACGRPKRGSAPAHQGLAILVSQRPGGASFPARDPAFCLTKTVVCRLVNAQWPFPLDIADDVGLAKDNRSRTDPDRL